MNRLLFIRVGTLLLILSRALCSAGTPPQLRVGIAGHAFDHLGNIGDQGETAAASGANIIYVTGLGSVGYEGLPAPDEIIQEIKSTQKYLRDAHKHGIALALGYICATSIVKLENFDKNWSPEFRAVFHQRPSEWRQQDAQGKPLQSWYGGDYQPACMNNPDWRAYERHMVELQLKAGCDGIFFDNPTVHPQGCYCVYCMENFESFCLQERLVKEITFRSNHMRLAALREFAKANPQPFLRFRATIGRDFLSEMRRYARSINCHALITANNSLNSSEVLFSQSRTYGYNIFELSKAEDFVVVEDMSSQPRIMKNGSIVEYTPTYKQLHAMNHGKPIVAVTLAEADYHTPPYLVRLAMAEAAANDASYLSWPTWPEERRAKMISVIRPQADFLGQNAPLFQDAQARHDVLLYLPLEKWLVTNRCEASNIAKELSRANVQFEVICEEAFCPENLCLEGNSPNIPPGRFKTWSAELQLCANMHLPAALVLESLSDLNEQQLATANKFKQQGGVIITTEKKDWMRELGSAIRQPSVVLHDAKAVRAIVRDQRTRTIVHLLNLNVERLSSFEEKISPVENLRITLRSPLKKIRAVRALSADSASKSGPLQFASSREGNWTVIETALPRLEISTLIVVE